MKKIVKRIASIIITIIDVTIRFLARCGIILIIVFFLFLAGMAVMTVWSRGHFNQRADDELSRTIYKAVGAKEIRYQGRKESEAGELCYTYYIHKEETEPVKEIIEIVNHKLAEGEVDGEIKVRFEHELFSCGTETVFTLCNYREMGKGTIRYDDLQYLYINRHLIDSMKVFDKPETYSEIPNIQYLELYYAAEIEFEKEVNLWYNYWPELETMQVDIHGDEVVYYKQFLQEANCLTEKINHAVSQVPEKNKTHREVEIAFVQGLPDGVETIFFLRNYLEGVESWESDYDGFQYLWICKAALEDEDSLYFDLETYKNIPNIRYLKIDEGIQKVADEQGIDWHEYWPELETIEVCTPENVSNN